MDMNLVCFGAEKQQDIIRAVETLLEKQAECIVCMDDMMCRHVLRFLQEKEEFREKKVKVISFYGGITGAPLGKQVETVEFDAKKLGFVTGNTLLDVIEGKQAAEKQLLPYRLHVPWQADKCS